MPQGDAEHLHGGDAAEHGNSRVDRERRVSGIDPNRAGRRRTHTTPTGRFVRSWDMATRSCPACGTQYVATVRRCIDCDATLVDDARPTDTGERSRAAGSATSDEQVAYELDGWGNQLKVTLEGMLDQAGVRRAWEAGALVVSAADEEVVDDLIATVEGDDLPALDDDVTRVALEIEGLDADGGAELDARLIAESVAHSWDDEGALIVAEADEDQVLAMVEEVLAGPTDQADGLVAQQALSSLYVAVDKLVKDPADPKLARSYVEAAAALDGLGVPYGFAAPEWQALVADTADLADRVGPRRRHADDEREDAADADIDAATDGADLGEDDEPAGNDPDSTAGADGEDGAAGENGTDGEDVTDTEDVTDNEDGVGGSDGAARDAAARALRERLADVV